MASFTAGIRKTFAGEWQLSCHGEDSFGWAAAQWPANPAPGIDDNASRF
jgi:hypothetical protein